MFNRSPPIKKPRISVEDSVSGQEPAFDPPKNSMFTPRSSRSSRSLLYSDDEDDDDDDDDDDDIPENSMLATGQTHPRYFDMQTSPPIHPGFIPMSAYNLPIGAMAAVAAAAIPMNVSLVATPMNVLPVATPMNVSPIGAMDVTPDIDNTIYDSDKDNLVKDDEYTITIEADSTKDQEFTQELLSYEFNHIDSTNYIKNKDIKPFNKEINAIMDKYTNMYENAKKLIENIKIFSTRDTNITKLQDDAAIYLTYIKNPWDDIVGLKKKILINEITEPTDELIEKLNIDINTLIEYMKPGLYFFKIIQIIDIYIQIYSSYINNSSKQNISNAQIIKQRITNELAILDDTNIESKMLTIESNITRFETERRNIKSLNKLIIQFNFLKTLIECEIELTEDMNKQNDNINNLGTIDQLKKSVYTKKLVINTKKQIILANNIYRRSLNNISDMISNQTDEHIKQSISINILLLKKNINIKKNNIIGILNSLSSIDEKQREITVNMQSINKYLEELNKYIPTQDIWTFIEKNNVKQYINYFNSYKKAEANKLNEFFIYAKKKMEQSFIYKQLGQYGIVLYGHSYDEGVTKKESSKKTIGGWYLNAHVVDLNAPSRSREINQSISIERRNIELANEFISDTEKRMSTVQDSKEKTDLDKRITRKNEDIVKYNNTIQKIKDNQKSMDLAIYPDITKLHISIHLASGNDQSHIKFDKGDATINTPLEFIILNEKYIIISNKNAILDSLDNDDIKNAMYNFLLGCELYFTFFINPQEKLAINFIPDLTKSQSHANYNKYLKYKTKYLELKSLINKMSIS